MDFLRNTCSYLLMRFVFGLVLRNVSSSSGHLYTEWLMLKEREGMTLTVRM